MSVQHANRGVVKKDLQLYYNREFSKSFRGEATTNLLTRTTTFDSGTWQGYCGSRTNVISNTIDTVDPFGKYNALKVVRNGVNTCFGAGAVAMGLLWAGPTVLVAGQTYTMSFYAKGRVGGELLRFGLNDVHTSGYYITLTTSWVRYSITFTNITDTSRGFQFISDQASAGETYYIAAPQLEQKSYATPYCDITENINVRAVTTTNLLTSTYSSLPTNWSVDGSGQGSIGTYSYIENNSAIRIVDVNSNTRFYFSLFSNFSASTTYTFSVKYRKVAGAPTLRFQIQWYNSSNVLVGSISFPTTSQINIYDIDGWQLAWFTITSPTNTAKLTWFIQDGDDFTTYTHTYDLKEPQIQTGTVPTAWTSNTSTANTLTSGGGLLDISGNNYNIDLTSSAISFDSGGFYFNGNTAGALTTPVANSVLDGLSNNTHTYECWIKLLGTPPGSSDGYFFGRQGYHEGYAQFKSTPTAFGGLSWYYDNDNTGWLSYTGALNTWYHTAYVVDVENSIRYLYINGTLNSSGALTKQLKQYSSGTVYQLGSANPDYASNMIVSNAKAYNRALTATEIQQNFNATRKTYGI
jgi:hypothetical protein